MSTSVISSHVGGLLRPFAAILCVDIEDHDGLLATDGQATDERVENHRREIVIPTIAAHDGRLVPTTGKSISAIFDSPLAAVRCAAAIRHGLVRRNALFPRQPGMQCRIGVSLAQLVGSRDDVAGNGLNAAARLQSLSEPGTIYISAGVYQQVKDKLGYACRPLALEKLDDATGPMPVYSVLFKPVDVARPPRTGWIAYAVAVGIGLAGGAALGWYWLDAGSPIEVEHPSTVVMTLQSAGERAAEPSDVPSEPPPSDTPTPPRLSETTAAASPAPIEPAVESHALDARQAIAAAMLPTVPVRTARPYEPFRDCATCPEMVDLPGGTFVMGSNDDPTEQPVARVSVPPFALGRLPVTIGEWRQCVAARACSYEPNGDDDMPMHNVSWNDAQQYAAWLSSVTGRKYRLPTEAEWEYAARAGTSTKYWWGNQVVAGKADCKGCGAGDARLPMKAGSFAANSFGLHDMAGGVTQWTADCWHKNYRGAPTDGSARDAPNCRERVLRGGSWKQDASYARASSRDRYDAAVRYPTHGLRVARSADD